MSQYSELPQPFFVLAPMDDVTDTVFRQVVAECAAPDLYFTEFVNVDGLQSPGRPRLLKKLQFAPTEGSLIAQLWGKEPDNFYKTAQQIADGTFARELGLPEGVNFAGIDLNMGCPAKSEVQNGTCSALINNRELAGEIIEATRQGSGSLPLSVKTRIGFNEIDLTWIEFLLQRTLNMLSVHARTRKEMSKVPAHWEKFEAVVKLRDTLSPDTLIVGNGDIMNHQQGVELAEKYGLDGIMIGRGVFQDPFAFAADSPWESIDALARINLYKKHVELFAATWQSRERPIQTLNKFCKIYISGFDGAKELREELMQADSAEALLKILGSAATLNVARSALIQ
jgi:tRNA-dihydrouridine synthase